MAHSKDASIAQHSIDIQAVSAYFRREFQLYYHPTVAIESQRLHSFEMLICWQVERAQIYSSDSFALVEDFQLDVPFFQWVLYEACRQMQAWQAYYLADVPLQLSVNLSARQLDQAHLAEAIEQLLGETGLTPEHLQLEMPAAWIAQNRLAAKQLISRLKKLGFSICIDDLDIATMSYDIWKGLSVKALKLSQACTHQRLAIPDGQEGLRHAIAVAKKAHIQVVAKGLETLEQADAIKGVGCAYGQGYFFSSPLRPRQAAALISSQVKKQPKELMAYLLVMNILSQFARNFLGKAVVIRYWQETKPKKPWLALIQPYKDRQLILSSTRLTKLDVAQQQDLRQWMHQFVERCSRIIQGFPQALAQANLTSTEKRLLSTLCLPLD